ncbi:hypothetical protein J1N35_035260 [Gossypium stocksii]|uniref:Aminotransferase-like plant mobile domain-containing protein n=1 Tax=Gossypium stocksii TaxID=47602 RepID=A0A9D3UTL6_9ROSI|nr:hypothetical protein J1N35_035260 [Gossypium stocksii]
MAPLISEDPHISDATNNMGSYRVLRGQVNGLGYSLDERLMPYLEQARFRSVALIQTFDLCLLGVSPDDDEENLSGLKFTWLRARFEHLLANATEVELICAARAYIMHIIGSVPMPDANNNRVHIMYLPLLADLSNARSYSWGSAVLAMLYRELCQTTKPATVDIGRCLTLLQSWALYRMPFLASVSHQPYVYPLVNRCSIYLGIERSYTVPIYRLMIEQHLGEEMDMSSDLQAPLEYIQWYSSMGKPYILRGQSTVVPPHMQRPGAYEPVADMEAEPATDLDLEPEPEPEQSHSHSDAHSYHLDVPGNDYFSGSSGGGYHYGPPRSYPLHHGTASGSSSSMPFEPHDFSAMFSTPPPGLEEDVGCREHPQHERRPP